MPMEMEKQMFGACVFARPSLMDTERALLGSSLPSTRWVILNFSCLSMVIASFLEQILSLNPFRQLVGGGQRCSLSHLFLENNQLKISQKKGKFWGGKLAAPQCPRAVIIKVTAPGDVNQQQ